MNVRHDCVPCACREVTQLSAEGVVATQDDPNLAEDLAGGRAGPNSIEK
jgi:hypothetical protein